MSESAKPEPVVAKPELTIEDARIILELAYQLDEHTGKRVDGSPDLIRKLHNMFPALHNDFKTAFVARMLGSRHD